MKKILLIVFSLVAVAAMAQEKRAAKSPNVTNESPSVSVTYGQPSKNGREIFGSLEKFGQVWRTGANKATIVEFKKDVDFGGKKVKAGKYALFTIPNEREWTVILNSAWDQFGAFSYEKNKDKNVAEVKVPVKNLSEVVEKLEIKPTETSLSIAWDKTSVSVPLKF